MLSGNKLTFRYLRTAVKLGLDICAFSIALIFAYYLRFPTKPFLATLSEVAPLLPLFVTVRTALFVVFGLYGTMWRYSSLHTFERLLKAVTVGSLALVGLAFFSKLYSLPRAVTLTEWLLVLFLTGGTRIAVRKIFAAQGTKPDVHQLKRVLIYGAGRAGELLLRNIELTHHAGIQVVGFLDDDPVKQNQYIHRKRVLGNHAQLAEIVAKHAVNEIYFSIPSLSGAELRGLLKVIHEQVGDKVRIKTIPGLTDLINYKVNIHELRDFDIADLLRRKPVHLEAKPVKKLLSDRTVLVVGGGGSIGSELCRQIATFGPSRLIVVDSSEFNVYQIESQLSREYPYLSAVSLVADAAHQPMMGRIFDEYKPDLVFHAAAYKHVPLMEINPWAAVANNINSTLALTELCVEHKVERLLLISTDKAVQPTSVMGATKRLCENILLFHTNRAKTHFMSVRFGNVLGSSGSVIPKFKSQIESGGPVTVTDRNISRYFMLISEAVELVLQACAIGKNGSIFVLDMGQPIKIYDLARLMIELHGFQPEVDIPITITGMRPGEKLHEQLYFEGEETATSVPNLMVLTPNNSLPETWLSDIKILLDKLFTLNIQELRQELKKLVPEYQPSNGNSQNQVSAHTGA